ncbi:MAG: tetratricopeptide repeat protein [Gammaproteobacteria bacterium]|nr:tetratricopeptide repeat protein [Gammaproteobacteria bacterium]
MKVFASRVFCLLASLLLGACSSLQQTGVETAAKEAVKLPYPEPASLAEGLDSELVFSTLAGEIALQRGDLETAYQQLVQTARLSGDAVAAEKATKVALLLKREDRALESVKRWTELAPNNPAARLRAIALLFDAEQFGSAYEQMEAINAINSASGQDAYLPVMAVLSKRDNRAQAMRLMRRYHAAHSADPEAGYALSMLSLLWKDYARAEADATRLNANWPDWSKGLVLLSRLRKLQGDEEGAVRVLQQGLSDSPESVELNTALARLLVELNRYQEAVTVFKKVNRLEPENGDALYSLGVLSLQLEQRGEAKAYFSKLWEKGSHRSDVAYYLGRIAEQDGEGESAIDWFRRVERGDYQFQAKARVAQLLAESGRVAEARDWIQNMRIQMPAKAVQFYLLEARILADLAQHEEVFALYREALEGHPENDDLLYARGLYAAERGRLEMMERDLRSVIARNPKNADALNALGYTLADRSLRYQEASQLIARALELKPDSAAIIDSMGWLQFRMGNLQQAYEYLQRAFDLMPDGEIAAHLGEVLWRMGKVEQAEAIWRQILQQEPQNRHVLETRKRLVH